MNILLHKAVARLGFDALLQHFGDGVALAAIDSGDDDATRAQFTADTSPKPIHRLDEINCSAVPRGQPGVQRVLSDVAPASSLER